MYVEQLKDGYWGIFWPDCTRIGLCKFKSRGWAVRVLREYQRAGI